MRQRSSIAVRTTHRLNSNFELWRHTEHSMKNYFIWRRTALDTSLFRLKTSFHFCEVSPLLHIPYSLGYIESIAWDFKPLLDIFICNEINSGVTFPDFANDRRWVFFHYLGYGLHAAFCQLSRGVGKKFISVCAISWGGGGTSNTEAIYFFTHEFSRRGDWGAILLWGSFPSPYAPRPTLVQSLQFSL